MRQTPNTHSSSQFAASGNQETTMEQQEITQTTAPVANLRETRKAQAAAKKAHPAGKAAPAKKAPAKKAAEPKPKKDEGTTYTYEAKGRFGITNRRTFPHQVAVAADVKDPNHSSPRWQAGVIGGAAGADVRHAPIAVSGVAPAGEAADAARLLCVGFVLKGHSGVSPLQVGEPHGQTAPGGAAWPSADHLPDIPHEGSGWPWDRMG
jgi:hypothetical protein